MRSVIRLSRTCLVLILTSAVPALACPVCYGESDSAAAQGINMGIWVLLGVTGVMLACALSLILTIWYRTKKYSKTGGRLATGVLTPAREN